MEHLQDMNLHQPNLPSTPTPTPTPTPTIIPKIEPLDEPLHEPLLQCDDEDLLPSQYSSLLFPYIFPQLDFVDTISDCHQYNDQPVIVDAISDLHQYSNQLDSTYATLSLQQYNNQPNFTDATSGLNQYIDQLDLVNATPNSQQYNHRTNFADATVGPQQFNNSRAIVPVPTPTNYHPTVHVAPCGTRKYIRRSTDLVRLLELSPDDKNYYRKLVRKTRALFDSLRMLAIAEDEKNLLLDAPSHRRPRVDLMAASLLRERGLWLYRDRRVVGTIPGVEVGDVFFFRIELCVVGLHGQPRAGIDYMGRGGSPSAEPIATSVIVSGGHEDDEDRGEVVVYTGYGGQDRNGSNSGRQVDHQKLEAGNWALERSMSYGIEVRVIRGFKYEGSVSGKVYVYDGLYKVVESWFEVGRSGFGVFKFRLVRIAGQEEMGSGVMRFASMLRVRPLEVRPRGYVSLDMSMKKERFPVLFYNDVDQNRDPVYYQYLAGSVFPLHVYGGGVGCDCVGACLVDGCSCAVRNGGEFAYNLQGHLVRGKPLVIECGPNCRCRPGCRNRVTQQGARNRFEVYRSRETGWGLRSLDLIPAGSFICEYAGIVLTRDQVKVFTMNGDNLIYPGRFGERWREWGDLTQIFSDYVCPAYPSIPTLDFAMDVSSRRNVACYISHSSMPNVFVQHVLYDHSDASFPRQMLFALENIPPMRELSLDYGVADDWSGKLATCN